MTTTIPNAPNTLHTPDTPGPDNIPLSPEIPEPLEPPEPPMHLYVCSPPAAPASHPAHPLPDRELSASVIQILEQLNAQNQLLVDLLGAVNGLAAAILCRRPDR